MVTKILLLNITIIKQIDKEKLRMEVKKKNIDDVISKFFDDLKNNESDHEAMKRLANK